MSFSQQLDNVVSSFIQKLSLVYNIPKEDLLRIWDEGVLDKNTSSELNTELNKLTKQELQEMCRVRSLKVSGTKIDLIKRLDEHEVLRKGDRVNETGVSVLDKIAKIPVIEIRRNKYGNFEHTDTSFVFNKETNKVYGKQNPDGSISCLTVDDINICHKFKFSYEIPSNLNIVSDKVIELNELDEEEVEVEDEELELEIEDEDNEEEEEELEEEEDFE